MRRRARPALQRAASRAGREFLRAGIALACDLAWTRAARAAFQRRRETKVSAVAGEVFAIADPLAGKTSGDGYAVFVEALRAWLGRHGVNALAWSFYGLTSGRQRTRERSVNTAAARDVALPDSRERLRARA